ncbi:hypothetical protein [Mameliella sp.]|uniref:hypothetical protein n=1 Tax=Mameliella sp. TaxID=1924940 RepID=UPI003BA98E55
MALVAFTHHARERIAQRGLSPHEVQLIRDYGESRRASDGARKFALSRRSIRELREDFSTLSRRRLDLLRRAYVVATDDVIVTAAFANRPLFN